MSSLTYEAESKRDGKQYIVQSLLMKELWVSGFALKSSTAVCERVVLERRCLNKENTGKCIERSKKYYRRLKVEKSSQESRVQGQLL